MPDIPDILQRFWTDLIERPGGPLALRFFIQPLVAAVLGVRDGIQDAKTGRSPYFWTVLFDPVQRGARLREGLSATGKVLVIAILLDLIYQFLVLKAFHPLEAVVVALALAFVPYMLIRGPAERAAAWWKRSQARPGPSD